jgi:hypothetical protein
MDHALAIAVAAEHWRRQLLASAATDEWFSRIDDPLVELLAGARSGVLRRR